MSRNLEIGRGGLGASEVSTNCHHADSVFLKGLRGERRTHFCTVGTQESSSLTVYIVAPSERQILNKKSHK